MVKAKDERRERRDISQTKPLMMLKLGILKSNFCDQPSGVVRHRVQDSPSKGQSSGIPHCQFVLEHRSVQEEAVFTGRRGAKCPLLLADTKTSHYSQYNGRQSHNRSGVHFMHKAKNGLSKMVLHAEQIELIILETSHMARYFRRRKFCRFTRKAFKRSTIKISLR